MQTIYIDVSRKAVLPTISAKQGDVGRKFKVVFTDSGLVYDLSGVLFSVFFAGDSGEGNFTHIGDKSAFVIDGNMVTVELISQMLTNPGKGMLCLVMSHSDGIQIGSWNIPYMAENVPGADSEAAKDYYTAFSQSASELAGYSDEAKTSARNAAQSATEAEQYATNAFEAAQNAFSDGPGISFVPRPNGVTQIQSVAQDYIHSFGTTGIWTWRKWASGAAECWGTVVCSDVSTINPWGSMYESGQYGPISYPFTFLERPAQQISVSKTDSSAYLIEPPYGGISNTEENTGGWNFYRPNQNDTAATVYVDIYAKGRWELGDPIPAVAEYDGTITIV